MQENLDASVRELSEEESEALIKLGMRVEHLIEQKGMEHLIKYGEFEKRKVDDMLWMLPEW